MSKRSALVTSLVILATILGVVVSFGFTHKEEVRYYWELIKGPPKIADAEIEIVSPKPNQLFAPGSTVLVEAEVRMRGQTISGVYILADGISRKGGYIEDQQQMRLVSTEGDVYRYEYAIENAPEVDVYSNVQITVVDANDARRYSSVSYLVKDIQPIKIIEPTEGSIFSRKTRITIRTEPERHPTFDKYKIYIDGKYYNDTYGIVYWLVPTPGTHSIELVRSMDKIELARSSPVTIQVK